MIAWHKDLFRRYESSWALLQRFRLLNVPSNSDFARLFGAKERAGGHNRFGPHARYDDADAFNAEHIQTLLGVSKDQYLSLFPSSQGLDLYWRSNGHLKYCVQCMALGYHSAVHQSVALKKCPAHRTPLMESCAVCKSALSYRVEPQGTHPPFACRCGHELVPTESLQLICAPLPKDIIDRIGDFINHAKNVHIDPCRHNWVFDYYVNGTAELGAYRKLAEALGEPASYTGLFEDHEIALRGPTYSPSSCEAANTPRMTVLTQWREGREKSFPSDMSSIKQENILNRRYGSCKRWLFSLLTKNHRECLSAMALVPKFTQMRYAPAACPLALAYERWCYYWEHLRVFKPERPGAIARYATGVEQTVMAWIEHWECADGLRASPRASDATLHWCIQRMFAQTLQRTFLTAAALSTEECVRCLDPVQRHWPGIGVWAYPRFYVKVEAEGGATAYCESGANLINEINDLIQQTGQHDSGHFKFLQQLKTWYYLER